MVDCLRNICIIPASGADNKRRHIMQSLNMHPVLKLPQAGPIGGDLYVVCYHDVDEICWTIRSLKVGHVSGQWSMLPTLLDGFLNRENSFDKKCEQLDNIAVYLIVFLKSK